jgi:integrase
LSRFGGARTPSTARSGRRGLAVPAAIAGAGDTAVRRFLEFFAATIRNKNTRIGMKVKIGCHTFRATGITAYLEAGGTLENAQAMAAHESPRTTKLYDRTGDEITLDEVERITI